MYSKIFSAILQADHQNYDHIGNTTILPIQREAQTKTLTNNILNYKETQNLRVPVTNRTKILDSRVGPCLCLHLVKEVWCACYNIYLGYQLIDKIFKPRKRLTSGHAFAASHL